MARPASMPASEAAISSSRTQRILRPRPLWTRLASSTRAISAPPMHTQASHFSGGKVVDSHPGTPRVRTGLPVSAPKTDR